MRFFFLFLLLFTLSCKTGDTENIWNDLTPAQQALVEEMAKNACLNEKAEYFDSIFAGVSNVKAMFDSNNDTTIENHIRVKYAQRKKERDKTEFVDGVGSDPYVEIDVNTASVTGGVFTLKRSTSPTYYELNYDSTQLDLTNYWDGLKTKVCDPSAANKNYVISSISLDALTYTYTESTSTNVDSNSDPDTVTTVFQYTIDADFPLFMEFLHKKVTKTVTFDNGEKEITEETWTPSYTATAHGNGQNNTDCDRLDDDTDYRQCFVAEINVGQPIP